MNAHLYIYIIFFLINFHFDLKCVWKTALKLFTWGFITKTNHSSRGVHAFRDSAYFLVLDHG